MKVLIQVESPYFTAGIVLTDDKVTQMAPISPPEAMGSVWRIQ